MSDSVLLECDNKIKSKSIYDHKRRIIAIGDIHGDLGALLVCLADVARVIKYEYVNNTIKYKWIGEDTYVVIVGDIIDRKREGLYMKPIKEGKYLVGEIDGEEDIIIDLVNRIALKAEKYGGKVIKLLGNHEIMNLYGDFTYVSDMTLKNNGGKEKRKQMLEPGKSLSNKIIKCGTMAIVKIGDWIFVHGGVLPGIVNAIKQLNVDNFIEEANRIAKQMFLGKLSPKDKELAKIFFINNTMSEQGSRQVQVQTNLDTEIKKLYVEQSPILNERRLSHDSYGGIKVRISDMCTALQHTFELMGYDKNKTHLVVAHSVQMERGLVRRIRTDPGYVSGYVYNDKILSDNKRTVYGTTATKYNIPLSENKQSGNVFPHGLNFECPYTNNSRGQLWRIDIGMSRAFDGEYLLSEKINKNIINKILDSRKPAALEILYDIETGYRTQVIIANNELPRKWRSKKIEKKTI